MLEYGRRETIVAFAKVLKAYESGDLGSVWDKLSPDTRYRSWLSWTVLAPHFSAEFALMEWKEISPEIQGVLSAAIGETLLFFVRAAADRTKTDNIAAKT